MLKLGDVTKKAMGKKKGMGKGRYKAPDRGGFTKPDLRKLRAKKRKS